MTHEPALFRSNGAGVVKAYHAGTHRVCDPAVTLEKIKPFAAWAGVTRLADLTQLDRLGIPTYQAVRPMGRLLSMTQGKGSTPVAAQVSALMEAIEIAHAEFLLQSGMKLAAQGLDGQPVCLLDHPDFDSSMSRHWLTAVDLASRQPLLVPFDLVSLDYSRVRDDDLVAVSNGLASGNTMDEAIVSALTEIIERDACAQWRDGRARNRQQTRVDLESIDCIEVQDLIRCIGEGDCAVTVWDLTTDMGVPVFQAEISEQSRSGQFTLAPAFGSGCHPCKDVALLRAIHEAAQTRIVVISSAREDLGLARFTTPEVMATELQFFHLAFAGAPVRVWQDIPTANHATSSEDRDWLLARLAQAGVGQIALCDLTHKNVGIPVVKIIVPGFGDFDMPSRWKARAA
jgi:ribosomal protein S12 methylthiotransferase accessory factor